jgi:signal transduction histidine kinase
VDIHKLTPEQLQEFEVFSSESKKSKQIEIDLKLSENVIEADNRLRRGMRQREKNKRDLILSTCHDLKNPIGAILASIELLGTLSSEEQRAKLSACIVASARGALDIVESLSSYERVSEGSLGVKKTSFSLNSLISELEAEYQVVTKAHGVELISDVPDNDIIIETDRTCLRRIIANFLQNAAKYTSSGGKVNLGVKQFKSFVEIYVADTGNGLSREQLDKLFSRYSRLSEHADLPGSGLGLYVCKQLSELISAKILVRSKIGEGSLFSVRLQK